MFYAANALAPNTRRSYGAGERHYIAFCNLHRLSKFPATDATLSAFAAHLASVVCPGTVRVYVSAVRNLHIEMGYADPLQDALLLPRVLRGICRHHGTEPVAARLPVTFGVLKELISSCQSSSVLCPTDKLLYQSAMLVAFFGFLRVSEFTEAHVTRSCVRIDGQHLVLHLKHSKTDPVGRGVDVVIGAGSPPHCPVRATLIYLAATSRNNTPGSPLYVLASGQRLTRQVFTATVRCLLAATNKHNVKKYASHSFRIGAATTAAAAGIPDHLIRAAGRWRSDSCLRYIRLSTEAKCKLVARMSAANM